jgi:hypothetical protein
LLGSITGATVTTADNQGVLLFASNGASGFLTFNTNATERTRIDSSGRLLVGTSTAFGQGLLQVNNSASIGSYFASPFANAFYFVKSRSATAGQVTVVQSGDELGQVLFQGTDGTTNITAAGILAAVDGTPGTNDMPGRLVFSTTADGASSPTEAMRITSSQNIRITTTAEGSGLTTGRMRLVGNAGGINSIYAEQSVSGGYSYVSNAVSNGGTYYHFHFLEAGASRGSITSNGSATAYNTSSDYRLKENILPIEGATDRVLSLKPSQFNFIDFPDRIVDGFIAHEAQAVVPECVTGEKDAVDDDGNPVYQGIDQSKLVPLLTAALQEAIAEIASLKDRVAALEAS